MAVFAGAFSITKGAAGGAGSLTTSKITGSTSAYISGAGTQVDALGTSSSDTLSVNSGTLAHALDLGSFNAPTDTTPDLSETQDAVRGLAVVASSHQAIVANVASLAASTGVSIMVNAIVNVMSGSTNAYIDSASIDTRLTSTTLAPKVDVAVASGTVARYCATERTRRSDGVAASVSAAHGLKLSWTLSVRLQFPKSRFWRMPFALAQNRRRLSVVTVRFALWIPGRTTVGPPRVSRSSGRARVEAPCFCR